MTTKPRITPPNLSTDGLHFVLSAFSASGGLKGAVGGSLLVPYWPLHFFQQIAFFPARKETNLNTIVTTIYVFSDRSSTPRQIAKTKRVTVRV